MRFAVELSITIALECVIAGGVAHAVLHDRGGGLIYDDVLDVTWLQDASYAKTSGYDADGLMKWADAVVWASDLVYYDSIRDVAYDDWRLPHALPVNGGSYSYNYSFDGSTDKGFNITSPKSELAYMFYVNLGNLGMFTTTGDTSGCYVSWPSDTCLDDTGPFINIEPRVYWTASIYAPIPDTVWAFAMDDGSQGSSDPNFDKGAWALRPGDVVPEPGSCGMAVALLSLSALTRRRRRV